MKNWKDLEPDLYKLMNKHFSPGRDRSIDKIVLHYNAGVGLSTVDVWNIWQSREASAHYQVETSGRIGQLVRDKDTAWHAGNWAANSSSIGIEHANSTGAPGWGFTKETLEEGAHLVAALCVGYGLGRPQWGKNVFPHSQFTSTSCPGELQRSLRDSYMARAQYWYDTMTGKKPNPAPAKPVTPPGLVVDGDFGVLSVKRLQALLGTTVDGRISGQWGPHREYHVSLLTVDYDDGGSQMVTALQRLLGVTADGYLGPDTIKALQRRLGVTADGYLGVQSAKALQSKLNQGKVF